MSLNTTLSLYCYKCGTLTSLEKPGRRDACTKCGNDLHCCKNCVHYDFNSYNECREPQAERVLDKEKSNFCDFFTFAKRKEFSSEKNNIADKLKNLDDLFK